MASRPARPVSYYLPLLITLMAGFQIIFAIFFDIIIRHLHADYRLFSPLLPPDSHYIRLLLPFIADYDAARRFDLPHIDIDEFISSYFH